MNCCELAAYRLDLFMASVGVRTVTPPAEDAEPITLEEAWAHLRIDAFGSPLESDSDFWLTAIGIPAARAWAETYAGITIAERTLEWSARGFPANQFLMLPVPYDAATTVYLPFGPLRTVESIIYADADNVDQTLDPLEYVVNPYAAPATVKPATAWPAAYDKDRSVRVTYTAGYSDDSPATPMPAEVRIGLLLMLGHLFENREDTAQQSLSLIPTGARTFLDSVRQRFGFA
jgi:uncharacterized phiE125 gp8 family phage protein